MNNSNSLLQMMKDECPNDKFKFINGYYVNTSLLTNEEIKERVLNFKSPKVQKKKNNAKVSNKFKKCNAF